MNKILVTGAGGLVGSALKEILPDAAYVTKEQYDLRDMYQVTLMFEEYRPTHVIHLAAVVGGVKANKESVADFFTDNILINTNVLYVARNYNVKKLISLVGTCAYPAQCPLPYEEKHLHAGEPHETSYGYSYAKRMIDIQSRAYRHQYNSNFVTLICNNLFGPGDNFDLENSHVVAAIIRKIFEAKQNNKDIVLWGDGKSLREFTYSKDLANILLLVLSSDNEDNLLNVGNSLEISIKDLAKQISEIFDFKGKIIWDTDKPSGQFRKPSKNDKFTSQYGENHYSDFRLALEKTCEWFEKNYPNIRGIK